MGNIKDLWQKRQIEPDLIALAIRFLGLILPRFSKYLLRETRGAEEKQMAVDEV